MADLWAAQYFSSRCGELFPFSAPPTPPPKSIDLTEPPCANNIMRSCFFFFVFRQSASSDCRSYPGVSVHLQKGQATSCALCRHSDLSALCVFTGLSAESDRSCGITIQRTCRLYAERPRPAVQTSAGFFFDFQLS